MNSLVQKLRMIPIVAFLFLTVGCGSDDSENNPPSLETVKLFISDLRTWSISANQELSRESSAFNLQLDSAGLVYDVSDPLLESAMGHAINAGLNAFAQDTDLVLNDFLNLDPLTPIVIATGNATLIGNTVEVNGTIDGITVNFTFTFPDLLGTTFIAGIVGSAENADASLSIERGGVTVDYGTATDLSPWLVGNSTAPFPSFERVVAELTVTLIAKGTTATDPVRFTGSFDLTVLAAKNGASEVVIDPMSGEPYYNPASLLMSGEFSTSSDDFVTLTHSYSANLAAKMSNASTFVPDALGDENIDNYRKLVDLKLEFIANLSGLPEAKISFTGNRTEFEGGNANLTIAYDGRRIVANGSITNGVEDVTVSISDGVTTVYIVVTEDNSNNYTYNIVSGSTTYGSIEVDPATKIVTIRYTDGSFEIL